jgi:predicted helicase
MNMHGNVEDARDMRHREGRVSFNSCNRNTLKSSSMMVVVKDDDQNGG